MPDTLLAKSYRIWQYWLMLLLLLLLVVVVVMVVVSNLIYGLRHLRLGE